MQYDVLIVGGGPVGLAAAINARLKGLTACVFERKSGVVDKACGEGIMPGGIVQLADLGVRLQKRRPFVGIRYLKGDDPSVYADGYFPGKPGYGVRRLELHQRLLERADELGVVRRAETAKDVHVEDDTVSINGISGRYLLAADGLNSPLRKRFGLDGGLTNNPRYGMRQHFKAKPWSNQVEVYWSEHGEAYVTPVDDDTVGVAFLFRKPGAFDQLMASLPHLSAKLGAPASALRGAGPFNRRARKRVSGRLLLIGDAAGYLDPLTGEGISLGIRSAALAIDSIASGDVEGYERRWRKAMMRYWVMTRLLLVISRPQWIRGRLVSVLRRLPFLFNLSLRLLGGETHRSSARERGIAPLNLAPVTFARKPND